MDKKLIWLSRLTLMAAVLAWIVIGLGAYTRLTDAGLGCPDWPGCYGHFSVPSGANTPVDLVSAKAWAEMIHRYFAGTLGLLIFVIAGLSTLVANRHGFKFLLFGMILFGLLIYQAALGMWTVTLKLFPLIVTQHLLGGMSILVFLLLLHLKSRQALRLFYEKEKIHYLKPWVLLGLILLCLQIALGAWTSTNYAALSCSHFPFCQANSWHFDFRDGFNLMGPLNNDFAKMTIHMMHRFGALTVGIYWFALLGWIHFRVKSAIPLRKVAQLTMAVLTLQILLGIANVLLSLPLAIAVAHNLCAALLLACVITLNYRVFAKRATIVNLSTQAIYG